MKLQHPAIRRALTELVLFGAAIHASGNAKAATVPHSTETPEIFREIRSGEMVSAATAFTGTAAAGIGVQPGESSVQGHVDTKTTPEPGTDALVGACLLALGLFGRRKKSRQ